MSAAYRIRDDETWAKARADYLGGDSARVVCERYDLGESAFNRRARDEGWRRRDQSDPEPAIDEPPPPARPFADSVMDALARADLALRRGKPAEAQRFLDLAQRYDTLAWLEEDRLESASIRVRNAEADAHAEAHIRKLQNVQKCSLTSS